jgi:hypothetical protein
MSARNDLATALLNGGTATNALATGLLDAYEAEVLAQARTKWPAAKDLQNAAAAKRASGTPEDIAIANLLNAIANSLAWLAPYRSHEGGYEMWGAATILAELINGASHQESPDFFQPGHTYTHRDSTTFHCFTVTTTPWNGQRLAIGWHTDDWDITSIAWRGIGEWRNEYDGVKSPDGGEAA